MDTAKILEVLKGARWYLVVAALIAFFIYMFKNEVGSFLSKGTEVIFKDSEINEVINRDVMVNDLLNDLMYKSASDRAYVFRFHNGQNYFDGTHKMRMSCEYEVVKKGIDPQSQLLKDIPTSLFIWFIKETIDGNMYYEDIDSISDVKTRVLLERQGIRSIAVEPYHDHSGRLMALIGVDYVGNKADTIEILKSQPNLSRWDMQQQRNLFINAAKAIGETIIYYNE